MWWLWLFGFLDRKLGIIIIVLAIGLASIDWFNAKIRCDTMSWECGNMECMFWIALPHHYRQYFVSWKLHTIYLARKPRKVWPTKKFSLVYIAMRAMIETTVKGNEMRGRESTYIIDDGERYVPVCFATKKNIISMRWKMVASTLLSVFVWTDTQTHVHTHAHTSNQVW